MYQTLPESELGYLSFLGPLDSLLAWPILWIKIMSNLNCDFKKSERMDNNVLIFQWSIRILNKIIQPIM